MTNEKTSINTTGPLWRVNYRYLINHQIRNQAYYVNAKDAKEARDKATELLANRFRNTGTKHTIGKITQVEM